MWTIPFQLNVIAAKPIAEIKTSSIFTFRDKQCLKRLSDKKGQNQDPIITSAINSVAITTVYPDKFHKFINWGSTSAINSVAIT